jgi:tetrapyrrole methylase family protein/MazG family protein
MLTGHSGGPILFRTALHPAAAELIQQLRLHGDGREVKSFDDLYEEASSFEEVYASIARNVVDEAATHGHVVYAVPGSPVVAERTVDALRALAEAIDLRLVPGLSFCDLAWTRLGIDPVAAGVRLVDGLSFAFQAAGDPGPLLVGQCWSNSVLSEVKLALEEPAEGQRAIILHHLGMADEVVEDVPWQEIDRFVAADHLTSIFVPALAPPVAAEIMELVETVASLRRLCPWDREQSHGSLVRHLLEETYEAIEAIEALGDAPESAAPEVVSHAEEELGDLLCQVVFHSVLAREEGLFDLSDVARSNREKLVTRHPHVFGDVRADTAGAVVRNWELIKEGGRPGAGLLDGIPAAMPALARVAKVERKLSSVGLGWADTGSGDGAPRPLQDERAAGDSLLALARELSHRGIDAESALRRSLDRLGERVREVEAAASRGGSSLREVTAADRLRWFRDGPPPADKEE